VNTGLIESIVNMITSKKIICTPNSVFTANLALNYKFVNPPFDKIFHRYPYRTLENRVLRDFLGENEPENLVYYTFV
jgi:hypothetical protein